MQYAMIVDLKRCVGCHACAVACRAEWNVPLPFARNWVQHLGPENTPSGLASTFYVGLCNHCDKPACVPVCPVPPEERIFVDVKTAREISLPVTATWKDPFNGTVQIDKKRCIGCGACRDACPFGARYVNNKQKNPKADKCTFCVERLAAGRKPACLETCIADALIFGDIHDATSQVFQLMKKEKLYKLESSTVRLAPNVYYCGQEKDIHLLLKTSVPSSLPRISQRRILLASVGRITIEQVQKNLF